MKVGYTVIVNIAADGRLEKSESDRIQNVIEDALTSRRFPLIESARCTDWTEEN